MTSKRDELATVIQDSGEYIPGSHGEDYINPTKAADAVIADGWTKNRIINDREELVEAGDETVVRDDDGNIAEKQFNPDNPFKWFFTGESTARSEYDVQLPAIVLSEPTA